MPGAKSGTAFTLVAPAAPDAAHEADVADPGSVDEAEAAQQASGTGKYGFATVKPFKPGTGDDGKPKTGWIEIAMVDESGAAVTGEAYSITLPDGTVATGTLDAEGVARVGGFDPGRRDGCGRRPDRRGAAWGMAGQHRVRGRVHVADAVEPAGERGRGGAWTPRRGRVA